MKKLLLVDSDEGTVASVKNALKDYIVSVAESGWKAIMHIDDHRYDLYILDMTRRCIDGQWLFENIMLDPIKRNRPVIMITREEDTERFAAQARSANLSIVVRSNATDGLDSNVRTLVGCPPNQAASSYRQEGCAQGALPGGRHAVD